MGCGATKPGVLGHSIVSGVENGATRIIMHEQKLSHIEQSNANDNILIPQEYNPKQQQQQQKEQESIVGLSNEERDNFSDVRREAKLVRKYTTVSLIHDSPINYNANILEEEIMHLKSSSDYNLSNRRQIDMVDYDNVKTATNDDNSENKSSLASSNKSIHSQIKANDQNNASDGTAQELAPKMKEITETAKEINNIDFDAVWRYLSSAIPDYADKLTRYTSSEQSLFIHYSHRIPDGIQLIPFWARNADKIEELNLSNNEIGPVGFRAMLIALSYLPNLKRANLSNNRGDQYCTEEIKNLMKSATKLDELDISCNDLSGGNFGKDLADGLSYSRNITTLKLVSCGLVDIGPLFQHQTENFTHNLKKLDISYNLFDSNIFQETVVNFLSQADLQLQKLNINGCCLSPQAMTSLSLALCHNNSICVLKATGANFFSKSSFLQLLTVCILRPYTKKLVLSGAKYSKENTNTSTQVNPAIQLYREIALWIQERLEHPESVVSNLTKLILSDCDIDPLMLKLMRSSMVTGNVQLDELDLSANHECIAEELRAFAIGIGSEVNILINLEKLNISKNILENIVLVLREDNICPKLKSLNLNRVKISPEKIGELSQLISNVKQGSGINKATVENKSVYLEELNLDAIKLSGTNKCGLVNLFKTISMQDTKTKVTWSLNVLSLIGCSLSDSDMKPIANAMKRGLSLEQLKLSSNRLRDDGIVQLVEGLKHCRKLQILDLANNRIGSRGATCLADCLSRVNLKQLLISGNIIGPDGVVALVNLSLSCKQLNYLDIKNQKSEFSDKYMDLLFTKLKEIIRDRVTNSKEKSLLRIKVSGIGEQDMKLAQDIDSSLIETNIRGEKLQTLILWDILTLIYCFYMATQPSIKRTALHYKSSYSEMNEGIGEVSILQDIWDRITNTTTNNNNNSTSAPNWIQFKSHRERSVLVASLSAAITDKRLEGLLDSETDCLVEEIILEKDNIKQLPNGLAWILFEDLDSVVKAVEYYKSGYANFYGEGFTVSPLAVNITNSKETKTLFNTAKSELKQRAKKREIETEEHSKLIEDKHIAAQVRHQTLLANPGYQEGRVW